MVIKGPLGIETHLSDSHLFISPPIGEMFIV